MKRFEISSEYCIYSGIFLLSFSVLIYELALTRVFSIIQWNYLAFMIISIAFLGYGASGTFLTITPSLNLALKNNPNSLLDKLSRFSLLYGISILLSIFLIARIPFDLYRLNADQLQWIYLTVYYLAVALPFFFAGICISLTITHLSGIVGKLYFFDLVGASLGCLTFLVLTEYLKVTDLIILLSGVALVSSFLFFLAQEKRKFPIGARHIAFLVAYLLVIFYSFSTLSLLINPYKECFTFLRYPDTKILYEKENSFSRIKVIESSAVHYAPGLSLNFNGDIPEQMAILTDDSGLSAITRFDGKKESIQFTDYLTNSLGYHLASKKERVFIIGAGGGLDILSAIYHNSQQIEAAELNPIIIDALKNRYADYSGQLFNRPEVRIIQGEGRSILKDIDHKVDLIQISLIGSASTSSGGFYSISENYIYTVEGMVDFLNLLSPDGLICITRWLLFPPRESVKLASIALEALQKAGAMKPENHLALIRSWGTTTLVCSKKPLDGKQNKIIEDFCQRRGFDPVYFPGIQANQVNLNHRLEQPYYYQAISGLVDHFKEGHIEDYERDYFFNITPSTDHRPFFFYFLKWKNIPTIIRNTSYWQPMIEWGNLIVFATLVQGLAFSFFFIFLPLFIKKRSPGEDWYFPIIYFASLGLSYMLVEISFIQKFILYLGNPTYASSFVIFSFLFFSGLGSYSSQRLKEKPIHYLKWIIPSIGILLVIYQWLVPFIFEQTLTFSISFRFMNTSLLIAPLAFLMGMPFPLGIGTLTYRKNNLIPWAWATNHFCSILASVSAVILAISFGFQVVGYLATVIYLAGLLGIIQGGKRDSV